MYLTKRTRNLLQHLRLQPLHIPHHQLHLLTPVLDIILSAFHLLQCLLNLLYQKLLGQGLGLRLCGVGQQHMLRVPLGNALLAEHVA